MIFTRAASWPILACVALAAAETARAATPINVPNGSFESATVTPVQVSGTPAVAGWNIQFTGTPYPQQPYTNNFSVVSGSSGSQAASQGANFLAFYPGEFYWGGNYTVPPPGQNLTNETLTMQTTGISALTQAGSTYTAGIDVGNVVNSTNNYSPAFYLSILDNGNVVATQSLAAGLTDQGTWHHLSVSYTPATTGDSLQIQLYANQFYEKGLTNPVYHPDGGVDPSDFFMEPTAMVDNATMSISVVPEPATLSLLGGGVVGLLGRRRRVA